ncbi:HAMP domain-containing sensor histidine kinase [Lysinibacillus sp. KU-BSD001]|uniref:sensor histidine kinase n=1 Tax=Lysinibacillus sp. KU-BSD001 TaxID=3141328 RepID=UPI0036EF3A6B
MKSLYNQFIFATVLILLCSIGIGFILANMVYYTFTKEKIDAQQVETAEEVTRILLYMHESRHSIDEYLTSVGLLGYQIVIISESGQYQYYGASFSDKEMPQEALTTVFDGEIYQGMQDFKSRFSMMAHFSNQLHNTVGIPFEMNGEKYGLFLRQDNKTLFSDFHMVLVGFILTIAVVSIMGVVWMTRQFIRPITQLTEATKAVSNENFDYALDITRKDELGQLAESFHSMQRQLADNDEARKAFISNVSHDFQSPLMNIQGYADLLQDEKVSDVERIEYSAIIDRESKHLSNLTKQLLLLTSLDQVTYPLKTKEVRIDEQLRDVLRKYQWRLHEQEMELSYKLEETTAIVDEELLVNVWDNLLSNAIKYTDAGGTIFISCRPVGAMLEVVFKDTGIGMTAEACEQVFERFYRVDEARKKDGTGLGLAIVKQIVSLHDGTIQVESVLGEGSTFTIVMPTNGK